MSKPTYISIALSNDNWTALGEGADGRCSSEVLFRGHLPALPFRQSLMSMAHAGAVADQEAHCCHAATFTDSS